ncbi:glycosyltransferase [Sphingomonas sp. R1]|uniref:glycosyltransferase n=1 Tax=Sphingomonas sp. R1 TaxID=399176 RepID=UPI00222531DE|nr:glycosyltransferase family 1 protein [Sphingomonas sp. R1]UYY76421.1 glycosyltransferase family 4 protein [Sphingomonas sp. R1]
MKRLASLLRGKVKRSAGVPVTPAVHSRIAQGNHRRDLGRWSEAAGYYQAALDADDSLIHIWVQLGHMRKEGGDAIGASNAYLEALERNPADQTLVGWLYGIAGRLPHAHRRKLIRQIYAVEGRSFDALALSDGDDAMRKPASGEIIFDISDLVAYFSRARRPTGIQRVQIEIIRAAIVLPNSVVRICCSIEESSEWTEISLSLFERVTTLAVAGDAVDGAIWRDAIHDLNAALIFGSPFVFGPRAKLVNLGTSWWLQNYFLQVRNAEVASGIAYTPFVHDLIPVLAPQHCVQGLVDDFNSWLLGVFDHARFFFVNSEATKRDLLDVAGRLGRGIGPEAVHVVPLDGAFVPPPPAPPSQALRQLGLNDKPFVLFVSTIESRKGHDTALKAWQRLLSEHGEQAPFLLCVGNNGWLNSAFYAELERDAALRERVLLLSGISDTDLAMLYRDCLFTIYPSTYEGWGLPVTEALSFGKIVIAANNSSLPEAGGCHAVYFNTGDAADLAGKVAAFAFDPTAREAHEQEIRRGFAPRAWSDIAAQIVDTLCGQAQESRVPCADAPVLAFDRWMEFRRRRNTTIFDDIGLGEPLRVGTGWLGADELGCLVREGHAMLRFRIDGADRASLLALRLFGKCAVAWRVMMNGHPAAHGAFTEKGESWALCSIPPSTPDVSIVIEVAHSHVDGADTWGGSFLGVQGCYLMRDKEGSRPPEALLSALDRLTIGKDRGE